MFEDKYDYGKSRDKNYSLLASLCIFATNFVSIYFAFDGLLYNYYHAHASPNRKMMPNVFEGLQASQGLSSFEKLRPWTFSEILAICCMKKNITTCLHCLHKLTN